MTVSYETCRRRNILASKDITYIESYFFLASGNVIYNFFLVVIKATERKEKKNVSEQNEEIHVSFITRL